MQLPHGTWPSPLTAEHAVAGTRSFQAVALAAAAVWWSESDPADGGRTTVRRRDADGTVTEVTPDHYVRTSVYEYGGGAWSVVEDAAGAPVLVWSSWPEHQVWVQHGDSEPYAITPDGASPYRYGGLHLVPELGLVLAVREDHSRRGEPVHTVVALPLGQGRHPGVVLVAGADFYASPQLTASGRLAWVEWDHPNMPWDRTRLMTGRINPSALATVTDTAVVIDEVSTLHPLWLDEHTLLVSHDREDHWQLHTLDVDTGAEQRLSHGARDICPSMWTLDAAPYGTGPDGVLAAWFVDGRRQLGILPLDGQPPRLLGAPVADVGSIAIDGAGFAVLVGHDDAPAEIVTGRWDDPQLTTVVRASEEAPDPAWTSVAESVWWDSALGPVQGWWYRPTHPEVSAPDGELPPLIVKSHGGPTAMSRPVHAAGVQYWTSRGYGVLDVNYGGSSGFGRAYRERLKGQWGVVDVADCIGGARALAEKGLVDPDRLLITGGSAGGFTTLAALTATDVFAAGISLYGIGDLRALARDTHKFESRYLDGLVGRWPEEEELYRDRSPISHVDRLASPMLVLQGTEDKVVPPAQAETIAAAVRAKGLPVALIMYEGEGHGFRKAASVISQLRATESFCAQVLGFTPAEDIPLLPIENL